ncbi:ribokinase [Melghirimyces profundicolus]|uniref:Ribokinase n=1 Tax=Melghirimyces profundicolus TaxID=1242148 RepID=A0A2T6BVF1_9BACL|nr:ribokinase [Melghirimyces profundicolus]PTX59957.1 ribokinase [Melghirimyces profundicolus]
MKQGRVAVIGSLNMDVVVQTKRPPRMGETVMGETVHFIPGGKGANQAVAAAKLGAETSMVGAVGDDPFGQSLVQSLQENGVKAKAVKTVPGFPTGVATILLSGGENCIAVVPGANSQCLPADVEAHREQIATVDVVLLQLEVPLETVLAAARTAKELGKTVILNPAPARELPKELYRLSDVITPNRSELEFLTERSVEGDGLQQAMNRLRERGAGCVVTTLGDRGAAILSKEGFQRVPGHPVEVVDTTGAGDAFNAGLACGLSEGMDLFRAVGFAGRVSALAVTRLGAQEGMPGRREVESFIPVEKEEGDH